MFKPTYNYEIQDFDYNILCQKIANQDTINFLKEFVQLFIIDKTEDIILKKNEMPESLYCNHTSIFIRAYKNGEITYKEEIVLHIEEEYNPKFLHLSNLFLSIALQICPANLAEKSKK